MAIIEKFYNGDRARNIREILNSNFSNVAKYIPNNFVVLTTTERQNLSDDYKTHFKLVFDKEAEYVYRWSEIQRNWEQYLIRAKDEYARAEADTNTERAFADVTLGKNMAGQTDPYTFTFYNRKGTAKDSVSLTAANVKFNNENSVQTIIQQLLDDLESLDNFVGNRDTLLNDSNITNKTVTGALKEINEKTINNKTRLDNIENGTTIVPKAAHAQESDLADVATLAKNSEKLGGQDPEYYATKAGLDATNKNLETANGEIEKNASDILELQQKTDDTNTDLNNLANTVAGHYSEFSATRNQVNANTLQIGEISDSLEELTSQVGWEILLV